MIRTKNRKQAKDKQSDFIAKTILHEAVAPYFANIYTTLVNIAQGVCLGIMLCAFKPIATTYPIDAYVVAKFVFVFLIICTVWHKHVTHAQYLAWRLDWKDTLIPMLYALLQALLIFYIDEKTFYFNLIILCVLLLSFWAYSNASDKYNDHRTIKLYKAHYSEMKQVDAFCDELHWVMVKVVKNGKNIAFSSMCISGVIVFFAYNASFDTPIKIYNFSVNKKTCDILSFILISFVFVRLNHLGLSKTLKRSRLNEILGSEYF